MNARVKFIMKFVLFSFSTLYINVALSAIMSTPGIERKGSYSSCTFFWSVSGNPSSIVISKLNETRHPLPLGTNANYTINKGIVNLTISNVQLSDAGNYSLTVIEGTTSETDSSALLFVYVSYPSYSSVAQTLGPIPATEGQTVELTCNITQSSLPVTYRPNLYYNWCISRFGCLQSISSGQAVMPSGDILLGYSIKNNGRVFVIATPQYPDTQGIYCQGKEEGSPYTLSTNWFYLQLLYRPYITSINPPSRKISPSIGNSVQFNFYYVANPSITSYTNWSFVNQQGISEDLVATSSFTSNAGFLTINFTSTNYYGSYSTSVSNRVGTTAVTFQVLPPGRPDTPANFRVWYVSHTVIYLQWNCMWSNGRQQFIVIRLKELATSTDIETSNITVYTDCYNATQSVAFTNNIQPETDYEATLWAMNNLGSSDIQRLTIKTIKRLRFIVSSKTISLNDNRAIINYTTADGNLTSLQVLCCVELTGACSSIYQSVNDSVKQIIFNGIPNATEYVFDFNLYGSYRGTQFLSGSVKGIRVSRIDSTPSYETDPEKSRLQSAVIGLAVVAGVAILALAGSWVMFASHKYCRKEKTQHVSQVSRSAPAAAAAENRHHNHTDADYENYTRDSGLSDGSIYTELDLVGEKNRKSLYP